MAKQVMPEARLDPRPSDIPLSDELFLQLSLFAQLKRKPSLEKFPGALILRRFRKGEVINRQGEAGWTAFYCLTAEDVVKIFEERVQARWRQRGEGSGERDTESLRVWTARAKLAQQNEEARRVATAHLAIGRPAAKKEHGLLSRLFGGQASAARKPVFIPIDGPRDIDYDTLEAPIYEGEIFGEMSCLYRTPRSATIVATRDCYMLELLRNIFDQLLKDPAFKAQSDELYKKRVFQLQLRRLSLFGELTDEQFSELRSQMELVSFDAGEIILDEHDRSDDGMYIVHSGMVRVLKKASALLSDDSVRSWGGLVQAVREGANKPGPQAKVWQLLPENIRTLLSAGNDLPREQRPNVLNALNDLIKKGQLQDAKEFQELAAGEATRDRAGELPEKRKEWTAQQVRLFNRVLLDEAYAGCLRKHHLRVGPDCVLNYCAKGDYIGEAGALTGQPRNATCIALGHPQEGQVKEAGRVELVRLPSAAFRKLVDSSPSLRQQVERRIADRDKQAQELAKVKVYEEAANVQFNERFERLGLIQGQRLMLIDLDRCTRCDECVRACVNTHDDGRSRLFLDGPRFGHFLVPVSCRSCLDPVCMIGCPVGSIHRGDNNQIVIEDWCIGCGLCANQCPYGSIQMHDIGIVPAGARGWRYLPLTAVGNAKWHEPRYHDHKWQLGTGPFRYDQEFRASLLDYQRDGASVGTRPALCFRYDFNLPTYLANGECKFRLEVISPDTAVQVWVNGRPVQSEKPKGGKREYWLPQDPETAEPEPTPEEPKPAERRPAPAWRKGVAERAPQAAPKKKASRPKSEVSLRAGRNVLAVQVTPKNLGEAFLDLRLDAVHKAKVPSLLSEEVTEKLVTERAVVCDLCSSLPGQVPSCVNACPHDAAIRVDARFEFPAK